MGHAVGRCGSPVSLPSKLLASPSPKWPYWHSLTKPGGRGVARGSWLPACPMHYCRGCSKTAAFAPWQWCTSTFPSGVECGGPRPEGRFAAEPGRDASAAPWPERGVQGRGHGHVAHGVVPSVVPSMVPSAARAPDWAATVLLPQAVEARSQDEGPEPEARQQVRGQGAPSAEPLAELGCPAPPVSAVGMDPGTNGSGRSRPRAWAVLGRQGKPRPGGTCLCMPGSPVPHERQSFSAPGRAAPLPCTRQESWHGG